MKTKFLLAALFSVQFAFAKDYTLVVKGKTLM